MAVSVINKPNFRGAIGGRTRALGTGGTYTPTEDGWLIVSATTDAGVTIPPYLALAQNNSRVASAIGGTTNNMAISVAGPVMAGVTYTATATRCTIIGANLFY